jgi:hypothetical protein
MTHTMRSRAMIGWGVAAAVAAFACGGNGGANQYAGGDATKSGQPAAGAAGTAGAAGNTAANDAHASPISLSGCLQKGDGRSDYILTEVNTTRTTVGTSGSTRAESGRDVVGQEQMRAALHAYRLDGDRDRLEPLVGKQVRVSGTVAEKSDLNDHDASGKMKEKDRTKIDEGDLAKVDVSTIESTGASCGGGAKAKARSRR